MNYVLISFVHYGPDGRGVFIGLILLIILTIFLFKHIKSNKEVSEVNQDFVTSGEKDVLGLDKNVETNTEGYTTLGKALHWPTVVLVIGLLLAMFLLYNNAPKKIENHAPVPSMYEKLQGE